jgi:hypothetical protein
MALYDVSEHNGSIDWGRFHREGGVGAICRINEGDRIDRFWNAARVSEMRRAGVFLSLYDFVRVKPASVRTGGTEVQICLRSAKAAGWGRDGDGIGWLDLEEHNGQPLRRVATYALAHYPGIYSSRSFLASVLAHMDSREIDYMRRRCPLWMAHPGASPSQYARGWGPWPRVRLLQDSWTATIAGKHPVDRDQLVGSTTLEVLTIGWRRKHSPPPTPHHTQAAPALDEGAAPDVDAEEAAAPMDARELQRLLVAIGWPLTVDGQVGPQTTRALKDFRRGWAGTHEMAQDAHLSDYARFALRWSAARGGAMGTLAPHFKYREFASKRTRWIRTHRQLVLGLEKARSHLGRPIGVLSAYRDYTVPGQATDSQHTHGNAIDPTQPMGNPQEIKSLRVFSGIGHGPHGVRHVDVRHVGPNTTGSTPGKPAEWSYATVAPPDDDISRAEQLEPAEPATESDIALLTADTRSLHLQDLGWAGTAEDRAAQQLPSRAGPDATPELEHAPQIQA